MTTAPETIYTASIMDAKGEGLETVDLRNLSADRLEALGNEADAAGDAELSAVIGMMLDGAEPIRIGDLETIRAMMSEEAAEAEAEIMLTLLCEWGHMIEGWLCISSSAWSDLGSEAANLAASR
jgi:hypothetical protein